MRHMTKKIGKKQIKLTASFAASIRLAKEVADPLEIAREAALEEMMIEQGIPYHPKFAFTIENVALIIHIGQEAAGGERTLEKMQELIFDEGFVSSRLIAAEYIGLIVEPAPKEEPIKKEPVGEGK